MTRAYAFDPREAHKARWSTGAIWQAEVRDGSLSKQSTEIYYLHVDSKNAPILGTNKRGLVYWKNAVESFGAMGFVVNKVEIHLGFAGQYFDDESSDFYNFHRNYIPETARYSQSDPIGVRAGVNIYAYAFNNPMKFTDYLGLSSEPCCNPSASDQDCCGKIPTNEEGLFVVAGQTAGGTVMCCQGRKVACVANKYNNSSGSSKIIKKCIEKHEKKHFDHVGDCGSNCDINIMNHVGNANMNECESYVVELECLQNSLYECGNDSICRIRIIAEINSTKQNGKAKYGCNI